METDDDASHQLMQIVHDFAIRAVLLETTCNTESLVRMIEQKTRGLDASGNWLVITSDRQALSPFVPKNMKKLNFLYIDALELARQLTILDSSLYSNIQPMGCLGKTWQKVVMPSDAKMAKIVKALGLHSDRVTNWVSRTILIQSNMKRRTLAIKHIYAKAADVIRDIQQYQNVPYSLQAVLELQEYIMLNLQSAIDIDEMYNWSFQVEPMESGDGQIAR
ncbi:cell division cycle-related protein [Elasticomyces elasticus]|nr:cell division cycle-related protein [Elasticomyces elasticus]